MKVLHSSDLHGRYKYLLEHPAGTEFDVWLDTGDFCDNAGRSAGGGRINAEVERRYQARWLDRYKDLPRRLVAWLRGRPALVMPGNHDFVSLDVYLRRAGANVLRVTTAGVECLGWRWAGFREVPWIDGEWEGEQHGFKRQLEETWAADPDVLVTHGPPGGILDEAMGYGNPELTNRLAYYPHNIRAHFFGHTHANGGEDVEEMGVHFYNGACTTKLHELDTSTWRS